MPPSAYATVSAVTRSFLPAECWLRSLPVAKILGRRKVYAAANRDRFYMWDQKSGHIEVYNRRGRHLGVATCDDADAVDTTAAEKGRSIDVS